MSVGVCTESIQARRLFCFLHDKPLPNPIRAGGPLKVTRRCDLQGYSVSMNRPLCKHEPLRDNCSLCQSFLRKEELRRSSRSASVRQIPTRRPGGGGGESEGQEGGSALDSVVGHYVSSACF